MQIRLFKCKRRNILKLYVCYFGISNGFSLLLLFSIFFVVSKMLYDKSTGFLVKKTLCPTDGQGIFKLFLINKTKNQLPVYILLEFDRIQNLTTRMGFEPTRGDPNGLAVHRLNHSATSSS